VDFEPGTSAVVRVEAGRLRRLLAQSEAERTAAAGGVSIQVPKGSYVPVFAPRDRGAGPETAAPSPVAVLQPHWAGEERRLVTVLSCAFGTQETVAACSLDGEVLDQFDRLHEACASIGQQHGGEADGRSSDRLIVYFGWPNAMEDSAGRAMTAAMQMLAEARGAGESGLGVRIGIATSEVVARDVQASGPSLRPSVVGEAPALAARLMTAAPLNAILTAESTRRLTGAAFELLPAGSLANEGREPTLLWRLLRPRPATRFQALHQETGAVVLGREAEAALLMSRWRLSLEGEGQAVLLLGEAGIGKSSLAESILAALGDEASRLRLQCSPHHANSTLYPLIAFFRDLLGVSAEDAGPRRLQAFLAEAGVAGEADQALFEALVAGAEPPCLDLLSASQRKDLTLKLLTRLLLDQADRAPTALLVEDVHWADPSTLELLQEVVRSASSRRLLVLLTSRPGGAPGFAQSDVSSIQLARLPRQACNALIDRMLDAARLPPAARVLILEKSEGIPLFLEELTKLFLASDAGRLDDRRAPESLSDLLSSQLDRLGATRSVAQVAAVIGRAFPREMLAQACGRSATEIDTAIDQLLAAGILVRSGGDGAEAFTFRHALLRDAAYGSLLDPARRALHHKVADLLVDGFPEIAADNPEIVAGHLMEAGRQDEAIPFWIDAGRKAADRYALAEAIADFRPALEALEGLEPSRENRERELEVLIQLGLAVRSARGYVDEELAAIYERARMLSAELGRPEQHANAVYGLWTHAAGLGRWREASALAEAFMHFAGSAPADGQLIVEGHRLMGASAAFTADFARARGELQKARAAYDPAHHGPGFGFDPGAVAPAYLSWTLWCMGEAESARRQVQDALAIADAKGHPPTIAMVLSWLMFHAVCEQDPDAVLAYNARLQLVCVERDCRYWQPFGAGCAAWAAFRKDGEARWLEWVLASTQEFRERYFTSCLLLMGAGICLELDRTEQGLELVQAARRFIEEHDERIWQAEADRLDAELTASGARPDLASARALARRALETARRQGATALEARAEATLERIETRMRTPPLRLARRARRPADGQG
jgi:class 3 adenylate cyclase